MSRLLAAFLLTASVGLTACGGEAAADKDAGSDPADTTDAIDTTDTTDTTDPTGTTEPTDTTPTDTGEPLATCNTDHEDCAPGVAGCGGEGTMMLPGSDCLACHAPGAGLGAPVWTAAGTAFERKDGAAPLGGATVRITDAQGSVVEMATNRAGNFYTRAALVPPLQAEIEVNGVIRAMQGSVDTGACSSCHACDGAAGGKLHGP